MCKHILLVSRHILLVLISLFGYTTPVDAQYEHLAVLNDQTLSLNRLATIPGVTWVNTDNPAYDPNRQRFFFQGNATGSPPWYLFTLDATTGNVVYQQLCPGNDAAGQVLGMQFDYVKDTLYCLCADRTGGSWFCWLDPATGWVHHLAVLTGFTGYQGSTFDAKDHLYICNMGSGLLVIDAATGNVVSNVSFSPGIGVSNLVYDNQTERAYAVCLPALGAPTFDSVSLQSGMVFPIAALPPLELLQLFAYAVDETGGRYFFVGTDPAGSACVNNYFYALDVGTGAVLERTPYPYAQNAAQFNDQNVIMYAFDQLRGVLYALNWDPPDTVTNPYIGITASTDSICPGDSVVFRGATGAGVESPGWQWLVNGVAMTGRDSVWTTGGLVAGDTVFCILTNNNPCVLQPLDTSNRIVIGGRAPQAASVVVDASAASVCSGDMVHFMAGGINGGGDPGYQWQLNGVDMGSDSSGFTHAGWRNGDVVVCVMTSADHCVASPVVVSNPVVIGVDSVAAAVSIGASRTAVCSGDTVVFTAEATNGGAAPAFEWLDDGHAIPGTGDVLSTNSLADGDVVQCIMTGSLACSQPVLSDDSIVMTVLPTPRIQMNLDTMIARGQAVRLDPAVTGSADSYQWAPEDGLSGAAVPDPVATPMTSTVYQLTVTGEDGCKASGWATIEVYTPLNMPSAFTPNGDGRNDIFRIPPGLDITLLKFSVYDRWGQRVFFTISSGEGWDGRVHGLAQPPGVYVWEIEYVDSLLKRKVDKSGEVILLR